MKSNEKSSKVELKLYNMREIKIILLSWISQCVLCLNLLTLSINRVE